MKSTQASPHDMAARLGFCLGVPMGHAALSRQVLTDAALRERVLAGAAPAVRDFVMRRRLADMRARLARHNVASGTVALSRSARR
jgi:hypothetical protein